MNGKDKPAGKPALKNFSGRPNPIYAAHDKKMSELDARISVAKSKLVY